MQKINGVLYVRKNFLNEFDKKHTPIFPLLACPVKFEEYFTGDRRGLVYPVKFSLLNISLGGEVKNG